MDNKCGLERYKQIRRILIIVLALNWAVSLAKIIYGILSRCAGITADGFHSFSDGASNIICLIGINIASRPQDSTHPYGHRKYETFFSLGIGLLLSIVAFNLFKEGITRLFHPIAPKIDILSFLIMFITTSVNTLVLIYEGKKGRLLKSDLLISDALHTRADILTSISVIVALIFIKSGFLLADPLVTIIISLFIGYSAYKVVSQGSGVLCDGVAIVDVKKIADIVLNVQGVRTCHKIRSRGRPDDIYIDLHVQVDPDMHVDEAHKVSYRIEVAIKNALPEVTDVVVHIEPKTIPPLKTF